MPTVCLVLMRPVPDGLGKIEGVFWFVFNINAMKFGMAAVPYSLSHNAFQLSLPSCDVKIISLTESPVNTCRNMCITAYIALSLKTHS